MKQIVYADLLFLVNFSMDFLCFFVTARLLHKDTRLWRLIFSSALGGVYSVVILFLPLGTVAAVLIDLLFCALMCICAFGVRENGGAFGFFTSFAVYFGVSVGTGGCMTAMYSLLNRMDLPLDEVRENGDGISVWLFGLLALISGIAASIGGDLFKSVSADTVLKVKIEYKGVSVSVNGLVDTGNMIVDPISARPVIVINTQSARALLGEACAEAAARSDISSDIWERGEHKLRIIPINTAGGSAILCAFVPNRISLAIKDKIGRSREFVVDALFAPSDLNFDVNKRAAGCAALVPPSLTP